MRPSIAKSIFAFLVLTLLGVIEVQAQSQQDMGPGGNGGQASQPAASTTGPGASTTVAPTPAAGKTAAAPNVDAGGSNARSAANSAPANSTQLSEDNPYDPVLEPPPLPKGKATLIGGRAIQVDHIRNRMTVQPFGGGAKVKVFVDERSHIYRDGVETTVLGIHKGDRVYVDTMLEGSKVFAKNVRVLTQSGLAEVRGQVVGRNAEKGTVTVRDQLSAKPVSFSLSGATRYSSSKGAATASDIQPGSLVEVQFSPRRDDRSVAQEVTILAKPGDNYIFSGVITNLDMRTNSFSLDNHSDDQTYEVHFTKDSLPDTHALKVGEEVTARTTFDGKQYKANNIRIESSPSEDEQSKAQ